MESTDPDPFKALPDIGQDLAQAMLRVLTNRFGTEFAREVRREVADDADRLDRRGDPRGRGHAKAIRDNTLADEIWKDLGITD